VLVQADHHFAEEKHQCCVDDKRQLESVFAKVIDETLEKLQDDKKSQQIGDDCRRPMVRAILLTRLIISMILEIWKLRRP